MKCLQLYWLSLYLLLFLSLYNKTWIFVKKSYILNTFLILKQSHEFTRIKEKEPAELISEAEKLGIENPSTLRKQEILFAILKKLAEKNEQITAQVF